MSLGWFPEAGTPRQGRRKAQCRGVRWQPLGAGGAQPRQHLARKEGEGISELTHQEVGCGAVATANNPTSGSQALSRPQWCPWAEEPRRVWVDARCPALWGCHGLLSSSRFQTCRSLPSGGRGCAASVQVCVLCEVRGIFVWRGVWYV